MDAPCLTSAQKYLKSTRYMLTVECCWNKSLFYEHMELMKQFLALKSLGPRGLVSDTIATEDMSDWLMAQGNHIPDWLRTAPVKGGHNLADLTCRVNANLMMRSMELQADREFNEDLSQTNKNIGSRDLSYLADGVKAEVVRGLRTISRTLAFQQCSRLCSPADVLVDLVPRLFHSMTKHTACQRASMELCGLAVTMALEVLENLSAVLKSLDSKVHYSRATGIHMVNSLHSRIRKLLSSEELSEDLDPCSPHLFSRMTTAVTAQVQRLFEKPPEFILAQSVLSWLSKDGAEASESTALPENTLELVLHVETIRSIVGVTFVQVFDGCDNHMDLKDWPLLAEVNNNLALHGLKVSKKKEKVNWHLNRQQITMMATVIHNSLHSLLGSKVHMQMAFSARVHAMTRALALTVTQEILKLRDALHKENLLRRKKKEEQQANASNATIQQIVILFLQKLTTETGEMVDHLLCHSLALEISMLVRSIADKAQQIGTFFEALESLKTFGLVPMANTLFAHYQDRFSISYSLGLYAFVLDENKGQLVANMLARKLMSHGLPSMSHSVTCFQLSPPADSWGTPKADTHLVEKTVYFDEVTPRVDTDVKKSAVDLLNAVPTAPTYNLRLNGATAKLQSEVEVMGKPKRSRAARFFLKIWRSCCCCCSNQEVDD